MRAITIHSSAAPDRVFENDGGGDVWWLSIMTPGGPTPGGSWHGRDVVAAVEEAVA